MTQRWKLTIEYDGRPFVGWQRQAVDMSVQSCVEDAVHDFCGERVAAHVAGRTDSGVHALGQVAHIDIKKDTDADAICGALNFYLRPNPVQIIKAEAVTKDFHARFSAKERVYCYRILTGRRSDVVIDSAYVWHVRSHLDVDAMRAGAAHLLGTHDLSSFRAAECQASSPVRTINSLEFVEKKVEWGAGDMIELWAKAPSFLHRQIRNMVGSLVLVGRGKWQPEDIKHARDAKSRAAGGPTAPPTGLFFIKVNY